MKKPLSYADRLTLIRALPFHAGWWVWLIVFFQLKGTSRQLLYLQFLAACKMAFRGKIKRESDYLLQPVRPVLYKIPMGYFSERYVILHFYFYFMGYDLRFIRPMEDETQHAVLCTLHRTPSVWQRWCTQHAPDSTISLSSLSRLYCDEISLLPPAPFVAGLFKM